MGQRYHRMDDQKPGPACGNLTRILLQGEDFTQKLKSFPKLSKLKDVVSQTNELKRPQPLRIFINFLEKNSYFNAIWITFRTFLEPFESLRFEN